MKGRREGPLLIPTTRSLVVELALSYHVTALLVTPWSVQEAPELAAELDPEQTRPSIPFCTRSVRATAPLALELTSPDHSASPSFPVKENNIPPPPVYPNFACVPGPFVPPRTHGSMDACTRWRRRLSHPTVQSQVGGVTSLVVRTLRCGFSRGSQRPKKPRFDSGVAHCFCCLFVATCVCWVGGIAARQRDRA